MGISPEGQEWAAKMKITNSRMKNHCVELMKNKDTKNDIGWKKVGSTVSDTDEFSYRMPSDLERRQYYTFRLVESNKSYYTKAMYLDSKGKWLDSETQKEDIEEDKKQETDENSAVDSILNISMYVLCGIFFL